jgi:hypothetical protein
MDLASCHPYSTWNFEVAARFLGKSGHRYSELPTYLLCPDTFVSALASGAVDIHDQDWNCVFLTFVLNYNWQS